MVDSSLAKRAFENYYWNAEPGISAKHIWPPILRALSDLAGRRIFEIGCGNGALAGHLAALGYEVTAVDISASGIENARSAFPAVRFDVADVADDLSRFGTFPIVISAEVVEHLYSPRQLTDAVFNLLEPGGTTIITTPFHGYLKNLALALSGKLDDHFMALEDGGHIKFWSRRTLRTLLEQSGLKQVCFNTTGRIPSLAKSIVAIARKPQCPVV